MKQIFSYAHPYKKSAAIALMLMLIELVVELTQPVLMAKIIDDGIVTGDLSAVTFWGLVLLGLSAAAFAAGITNSFYAADFSQGVGHDLRRDLFEKVQYFTDEQFQTISTPSLVTRITNDVIQLQSLLFMLVRIGLRAPLFIITALIMALTIDIRLSLILIGCVPVFLLFLFFILIKGVRYFKKVQEKLDALNSVIRQNLSAVRLVKGFNRKDYEEEQFRTANAELVDQNKKALWLMETAMPMVMFGMNAVILILLWTGSGFLSLGSLQPGELVAIINYATRILFTFSVFTFLILMVSRGQASAERVEEVLMSSVENGRCINSGSLDKVQGGIRFLNVSFQRSGHQILRDISFEAESGSTVGIIGETGAGKTSLLHLIPRLYEKESGQILFHGRNVEEYALQALRQSVSLVPQEVQLFSGTVRENIGWGKEGASEKEIEEAAAQAQIAGFIESLPEGYDTQIGQKGVVFSGGQKQRLSIARALVRKPSILLLDDSTSALDARTEQQLMKSLENQSCTVFLTAQKISSIQQADLILLLDQGRIAAKGTHEELLETSVYYRQVFESQKEGVMS
ncbi:ATP-binding cassette domain-containing protein [Halobacillus halophilus]|uniref:ABC transporter ATP-binding protein n=1 Tax=Halobacillus halophilus TaxID=1570 RepID=UPI00136FCCEE|nr:ABC transporter ATP-binding protein [Halobacillus halophilus]MYL29536.1 ATP-binding cassette domain-containing protein [Halobacillus halophilus]